jgi:hypothetical protein
MDEEDNNKEVNLAFDIYDHCHSASPSYIQPSFLYTPSCPVALFQYVYALGPTLSACVSLSLFIVLTPGNASRYSGHFSIQSGTTRRYSDTDRPWHYSVSDRHMHPFMCPQAGASRIEGSGSIIYMARRIHRVPKGMRRISI